MRSDAGFARSSRRLADSLTPLRATGGEIEGIIGELRTHKHKLGRYLRVADLQSPRG